MPILRLDHDPDVEQPTVSPPASISELPDGLAEHRVSELFNLTAGKAPRVTARTAAMLLGQQFSYGKRYLKEAGFELGPPLSLADVEETAWYMVRQRVLSGAQMADVVLSLWHIARLHQLPRKQA